MPIGVFATAGAVLAGGFSGAAFGKYIKRQVVERLVSLFGIIAICFGILAVIKVEHLPAVVLSVVLGTLLGELLNVERWLSKLGRGLERLTGALLPAARQEASPERTGLMVSVLVMFCFTGTGIYGAMYSGITGDHSLLLSKAVTDFFVACLFGMQIGYVMMAVALPQAACLLSLFYLARLIMPLIDNAVLMDFSSCGGMLMIATGLRIANIKDYHIGNMLPAFVLVFPISALWTAVTGL